MKQLSSARELVVTASNSKAFIVAEDGTLQPLMIGQRIPAGAVVQIAEDGELQTEPVAPVRVAQHLTDLPSAGDEPAASASSDIEKLQKSILAGIDPTLDLEATAAGGAAAAATGDASGSGNGGFIVIDRTSDSTLATAGFDTSDETTTTTSAVSQPADAVSAAANTAPATSDIELTTNEDQPITGAIVATDGDGDSLSYTLNGSPANGAVILNADGTFTYTPAGDFNGSDRFSVTISDGKGGTTTSTVTIGVAPQNDAPTTSNVSLNTNEDTAVSGAIVATDLDGDSLSYTVGSNPANGSVTLNADGTFTYTPAKDFNGSDSFSVTISDGQGGTTTSTVTIGVAPLNDAPTTSNVSLNTNEDTAVSGAIVATDLDGDSLSYTVGSNPANGSVTLNADGTFTYTPAKDFNGSDSFSVTISDGQGGTTTSTVTIGVAPLNDAPTSTDLSLNTDEDTPVTGSIIATDLDGDSLSYTVGSNPANGSVTLNADGTFVYTPASNFNGSDSFSVTISDGQGGTTTSTVTIGVAPVTDITTISLSSTTAGQPVEEGQVTVYTVSVDQPVSGSPLNVTLSNGVIITIPVGASSAESEPVVLRADDAYDQGNTRQDVSVTKVDGGNFEQIVVGNTVSDTIVDDVDSTTVTLSADVASVSEAGGAIVYTATLSSASHGVTTVETTLGTITIADGEVKGELTYTVPAGEDVYKEAGNISNAITSASGGNFEQLSLSTTSVVTPVLDTVNNTTVTLSADVASVSEAGGAIVYTATLSSASHGVTTVETTLGTITIADGEVKGELTYTVPAGEDVYKEAGNISNAITSASGGNFEQLSLSTTSVVTPVLDTVNNTTVTLSADVASVSEAGGAIVYTATLSSASHGVTTVETTLGTITIADGEVKGELTYTVPAGEDVYKEAGNISNAITSASGGNFEQLSLSTTSVVTPVLDTVNNTTVTLSADVASVSEAGGAIVYTATLSSASHGVTTVETTLGTITIADGEVKGELTYTVPAGEDVYKEAGNISNAITSASGGNFEQLSLSTTSVVTPVLDTVNNTTVTLSADVASVSEAGGAIVYTATLSSASHGVTTVETTLGTITIADGEVKGELTYTVPAGEDVYKEAGNISNAITSASGGNFEQLSLSTTSVVTPVLDTVNNTTVTLSADVASVSEAGGAIVYTATLSSASHGVTTVETTLGTITIADGEVKGELTYTVPAGEDVYKEAGNISNAITSASGGNFEQLSLSTTSVVTPVLDTVNNTTVTLSADVASVSEAGGAIVYTATLSSASHGVTTVETTLGTITIADGEVKGELTYTVPAGEDVYKEAGNISNAITSASGGNFEQLSLSTTSVVTPVLDTVNNTTVTLSADVASVSEAGGAIVYTATLSSASHGVTTVETTLGTITIADGEVKGELTYTVPAGEDVYKEAGNISNAITSASGGNFEQLSLSTTSVVTPVLDTVNNTTVTLSADVASVSEAGGAIVYTATLSSASHGVTTVETTLGTITIADGEVKGELTYTVPAGEDVYKEAGNISNAITSASGGNFEQLSLSTTSVVTPVLDTVNNTTVTLSADVASVSEAGGAIVYTATLSSASHGVTTVETTLGTITIADGEVKGELTYTVPAGEDVYKEAGNISNAITSASGGNFEQLSLSTTSVVTPVLDTVNNTTVTLSADVASVSEAGGAIVYTATLSSASHGVTTVETTLGTITIADGEVKGELTYTVPAGEDVYKEAGNISNAITSASGGNFEQLSPSATPVVTDMVFNPTSTNDIITIQEDIGNTSNRYILQVDDFGSFSDQDAGDKLQMIRIDSLPANGTFYLNGVAITSAMVSAPGGVTIKVSDISAKNLKFDPADNSDLDSSFKFSVSDGTNWSNTSYTTQLNITALADLPTLTVVASSLGGHALEPMGSVGGNGLILNYYDNVSGLDYGNPDPKYSNAVSTETVESVLEVTNPTSSTTVTDLGGERTISVNDAFSAKGLIYLEAGHSYKFSGEQDDTFRLEIGGSAIVKNGFNSYGQYGGTYTPTTSGYYSFEMFAYNGHGPGNINVLVSVDGGATKNLSTSNIPLFTGIDAVDKAGLQHGAQTVVGDGGYYAVEYNHGMAETAIALSPISPVLTDLDLSESLALKIGSIPAGAVLSDGIHSFTATTALGSIDISTWNSSFLKLTPPDGFAGQIQLTITATATESSNADHASTTSNLLVTVDATAGETTALLSTYTLVDSDDMGLSGEYYGYNERGNAKTSTESSGTNNSIIQPKDGLVGNLDDLSDVYSVINAKQDVATSSTGSILIGQTNPGKASASATDAVFVATTFDYGGIKSGGALANLGDGNPLLMTPGSAVTSGHLYTFLNDGASRGDASSLVTTSGFGSSTDSIIRMLGSAYFEAGKYDFQISADDGFALYVDGKLVVQHYKKTAGSTETNESLNINLPYIELSEGLHNIEVVYWDQGGSASFDLSYKLDSVKTWTAFNSNNLALFQDGEAPTLGTLDDLVKGTDGHWYIQTGVDYSAGSGSDTITGTDGKDIIYGNSGNDTLAGGGNNDVLDGGLGNDILVGDSGDDVLTGGDGNDTFKWVKGDAASPAVDHVTDFDVAHDVLDISDLLEGYSAGTTDVLKQYLSVGSASDGSTTIEVHNSTTSSSPVVQTIVLDGMSYSELTGSGSSSASDVLNHLIDSHLLNIDK